MTGSLHSRRRAALVAAALTALLVPTAAGRATTVEHADCERTSWVAGTAEVCAGELVYRDYVYDDYGANRPARPASASPDGPAPAGDERYQAAPNTADLLTLRLRVEDDVVRVTFELNSLFVADSTTAALVIDADDDRATGGGRWPGISLTSDGWDVGGSWSVGDPTSNTIEGTLARPRGDRWRVQAAVADRGGAVMNVAFRAGESGHWWEDRQAAALAAGDVSAFGHTIDVADLTGAVTRLAPHPGPGLHQRVYESAFTVPPGEGVSYEGVPGPADRQPGRLPHFYNHLGRHQPYAFYVPASTSDAPRGVQVFLHGRGGNHGNLWRQPGFLEEFGDRRNRYLVSPLGRGPTSATADWAERDILDALADVQQTYDHDPDLVFVSGYSMGGYGATRLATLHPDRFAGYVNLVGPTGDEYTGTPLAGQLTDAPIIVADLLGNLRNLPGVMSYSALDELVWVPGAIEMERRLQELGNPYRFHLHANDHLVPLVLDSWAKEAAYTDGLRRDVRPARVTFRHHPWTGNAALGIVHDRAYWLSEIRNRDESSASDSDVTTRGCGRTVPRTVIAREHGTDPVPWIGSSAEVVGRSAVAQEHDLVAHFTNVASVTVDVDGACLADDDLSYSITSDGPLVVRLSDGREIAVENGTTVGTVAPSTH